MAHRLLGPYLLLKYRRRLAARNVSILALLILIFKHFWLAFLAARVIWIAAVGVIQELFLVTVPVDTCPYQFSFGGVIQWDHAHSP